MKQIFARGILLLLQFLFFLTLIILFIARQQRLSPELEILHLQDCQLPCWIGIVPGKTTIGEAETLLRSTYRLAEYDYTLGHNPFEGTDWLTITRRQDGAYLIINFNRAETAADQTEDTIISQITIGCGISGHIRLGDWAILLGKPQALSITWGNHYASPNVLYYSQGVRLTLDQVDNFVISGWDSPASSLSIFYDLNAQYPSSYMVPWKGWTTTYKDKLLALMLP
ncbi:MAG: hypothetical protein K8J31_30265 [Anaerolineae bacterium]|nr:hypothetical protein [Anaerolineae bacterium]